MRLSATCAILDNFSLPQGRRHATVALPGNFRTKWAGRGARSAYLADSNPGQVVTAASIVPMASMSRILAHRHVPRVYTTVAKGTFILDAALTAAVHVPNVCLDASSPATCQRTVGVHLAQLAHTVPQQVVRAVRLAKVKLTSSKITRVR
jgi:hypothetical protein